ncbi:hypothetical protein [Tunturiibacter gelidiferens]|uniref:Uncharacterized protein n=1 Tax=Tunturiibacter gelidiferens TaxID=3069689 RepID=A0AAU7Z0U2_9BACT
MEFVDFVCSDDLGVADGEELGTTDEESVESGDARTSDGARIRVVEAVVVDEIVAGQLAEPAVAVDSC